MVNTAAIYILGINSAYHESAAAIIKNGRLLAAVEEERFNRIKHAKCAKIDNPDELPVNAINYCLKEAGIKLGEVNHVCFSFNPEKRLKNIETGEQVAVGGWGSKTGELEFHGKILGIPDKLNALAGRDISARFHWLDHHLCHASSAFFVSPFEESAILSVDGIGEFTTTLLGFGKGNKIEILKELRYPNSLGFLWEKIAVFLGFTEYDSAKVMGLASYGDGNKYHSKFQEIVKILENGEFTINNNALKFRSDDFEPLEQLLGVKKATNPSHRTKEHEDIAAGLQRITDEVILSLARYLSKSTGCRNLCMAGGVALNCSVNSKILLSGYFENIYIQPAAHDAGTALGAAHYFWNSILDKKRTFVMRHPFWGPKYDDVEIENSIKESDLKYRKIKNIENRVAALLSKGKIVGWFQGRLEWGPRALGNRSLLADPRSIETKNKLNKLVKKREGFRPFAPSVLEECASEWFEMPKKSVSSEFMLFAFDVRKEKRGLIPAVTHVDGTSRIQIVTKNSNPKFHGLISAFRKITGVPLLLNTSFNDNEPIVCSPRDATNTFSGSGIDHLAIGDFLVRK